MAELSEADVQFVKDLRQAKEEGRISRRDALKVAGALGLGGVVGGAGGASMFGTAAGGASTSDSDGNVGLPGDRVDVFADGVDGKAATIDSINNVLWAEPGNLQSQIDKASDSGFKEGAVALQPDAVFSLNSRIHVKEGVVVIGNKATLNVESDVDGVFWDNDTRLLGSLFVRTSAVTGYTSNAVVLDTSQSGTVYRSLSRSQVEFDGRIHCIGDKGEGTGLYLKADGNYGSITLGNKLRVSIAGFDDGIKTDVINSSFINPWIWATITNTGTHAVNQVGDGTGDATIRIWGIIESSGDYGIRNQVAGVKGARFWGYMSDAGQYTTAAFDGNKLDIRGFTTPKWSHGNLSVGTTIDRWGKESANAETPTASEWDTGSIVTFTDTGDGSGDGVYKLDPGGSWNQIA